MLTYIIRRARWPARAWYRCSHRQRGPRACCAYQVGRERVDHHAVRRLPPGGPPGAAGGVASGEPRIELLRHTSTVVQNMCAQPSGSHRAAQVKAPAPLPGMHQISQLHGHDRRWREMVRHLRTNSHQRRADPCGPAGGEAAERRRRVRAEARASGATSGRTILRASTPQGLQVCRGDVLLFF